MPIIGPLEPRRRAMAVAYVFAAVRGLREVDSATVERVVQDLRQRFGAKQPACH
jgi:hypothetical protein